MKRTLLTLTILALSWPAWQVAKSADVSVDFFYNNLSGGSWIEVADYGYCWQPDVVVSNTSWRPYADGYWAYTDLGWTWVSYEDFGWATYHYGRWSRLADYGWVWVPGRDEDLEWGPAWVSWRTGGDYVGWAPLPPARIAFREGGIISGQVDVEFDIGPAYYNFIDARYIGEPVLRERIVDVNQNVTYINQTVNVTNITYKNKVVYNYGPDINVLNQRASRPIQRLKLERQENVDLSTAAKSGALTKVQGDKLVVGAPMRITKPARQVAPPAVKAKVAQAKVDKGWSVVGDENAQKEFKQKLRSQRNVAPPTGAAGAAAQATAGASPAAGVSPTASPATAGATSPAPFERGRGKGRRGAEQAGSPTGSPGAAVSPAGPTSPTDATGARERGRHKGRRGDELQATPPAGASSPTGVESPGETTAMPERGKHRGRGQMPTTPTESTNAPSGAPSASPQDLPQTGGGKHRGRQLERGNVGASPGESGNAPGETERGKHKGRGVEQGATQPTGAPSQEAQGQGGRRRGQAAEPGTPAGTAESQRGQGRQGGGKQKPEASPAASPSPQQ